MGDLPQKRRIRLRWIALTLMLMGAAAGWFYFQQEPPSIEGRTSDGLWQVRFLAAGAGRVDYLPDSQLWESVRQSIGNSPVGPYMRWLPGSRNIREVQQLTRTGVQPLTLLLHEKLLTGSFPIAGGSNWPDLRIEFVDSNGFTYPHHEAGGSYTSVLTLGETWATICNASFPRRNREFTVQVVDRSGTRVLEFLLPNPAFQSSFPEWKGTPLPTSASRDKFTLHLRGFAIDSASGVLKPQLEVEPHRDGWKAELSAGELEDATGNYGYMLSPWEPCWKLPVYLECTADPESPASEQLKLGPVALPAVGSTMVIPDSRTWSTNPDSAQDDSRDLAPVTRTIGRTTVTIAPPRNWKGDNGVMPFEGPADANFEALFEIDTARMPATASILAAVHDQAGNELTAALPECWPDEAPQKFALPFKAGDDVKTHSISLMISDRYQVDFFVLPPAELREQVLQWKAAGSVTSSAGTPSGTSPSPP